MVWWSMENGISKQIPMPMELSYNYTARRFVVTVGTNKLELTYRELRRLIKLLERGVQ